MKEETNPTRMKAEANYGAASEKTWMKVHGGFARDMTLRDYYAGLAFEMRFIASENWTLTQITQQAYADADAMLKAR